MEILPKLEKLHQLMREFPFKGFYDEKVPSMSRYFWTSIYSKRKGYCIAELASIVQASEVQLSEALRESSCICIDGRAENPGKRLSTFRLIFDPRV